MGWAHAINAEGRKVGYAVQAQCDHPECHAEIDRGLSYVCGGMHDGDNYGCGGYFCPDHLVYNDRSRTQLCAACDKAVGEDENEGGN